MLQKSRTPRLKGLKMYEKTSIGTKINAKRTDVPEGINNEKKFKPCFLTHIIFIPIKIERLKESEIIAWLVTV